MSSLLRGRLQDEGNEVEPADLLPAPLAVVGYLSSLEKMSLSSPIR
jgi:hypothetical protein